MCGTYVDLADVENFAVADQALLQVLLHGGPEYVIRLYTGRKSAVLKLKMKGH